jgi:hypothetical protein
MRFHPVSDIFPLLEGDDFDDLVADIKQNGLIQPIWTHEERILDGRNRYRACMEAKVDPVFRKWSGRGSLVAFVVSMNLPRRHLSSDQRAVLGFDLVAMFKAEAGKKQKATRAKPGQQVPQVRQKIGAPRTHAGDSSEQAAKVAHTNRTYISAVRKLHEQKPELLADVRAGKKTLKEASQAVKQERK